MKLRAGPGLARWRTSMAQSPNIEMQNVGSARHKCTSGPESLEVSSGTKTPPLGVEGSSDVDMLLNRSFEALSMVGDDPRPTSPQKSDLLMRKPGRSEWMGISLSNFGSGTVEALPPSKRRKLGPNTHFVSDPLLQSSCPPPESASHAALGVSQMGTDLDLAKKPPESRSAPEIVDAATPRLKIGIERQLFEQALQKLDTTELLDITEPSDDDSSSCPLPIQKKLTIRVGTIPRKSSRKSRPYLTIRPQARNEGKKCACSYAGCNFSGRSDYEVKRT
ncbi:hypothetical protein B0H15DRAFT_943932 [Mycena belliarum]|uniref:Uncharacterized protein n=1 Tax=Mycena belliarum TaxID=1033014 RepID=A0AAD6UHD6_9AGAR|nr:hypothetical protein B0H15DRAFT_943932 [Mycena belliae]